MSDADPIPDDPDDFDFLGYYGTSRFMDNAPD
jgi:hypothetical protein